MVLLVGAALFARTFVQIASVDPGFRPDGVLTLRVSLPQNAYPDTRSWMAFFRPLLGRARSIPGVEMAAVGSGLPLIGTRGLAGTSFDGRPQPPAGGRPVIPVAGVSVDYFRVLGVPILRGRDFMDSDENGPRVAIVNQSFVDEYFPGENALGKRIEVGSRQGLWTEIVGIARNVKQQGRRSPDRFMIYQPLSQRPESEALLILKTSRVPTERLVGAASSAIHAIDPNLPVYDVATMDERLGVALSAQRANMTLMIVLAALALLLASVGIFGVITYLVNRRAREIAIRLALGATRVSVLNMVMRRSMALVGIGILLGLMGATVLGRTISSLLEGIQPNDLVAYSVAIALFISMAAAACLIPARAALRIEPMTRLRHD
jgi:predicted permease